MDFSLGEVLRELRRKHDYQQQDVVKRLNDMGIKTAKAQVSRWENGRNNPNIEQFIGLCGVYGVEDVHKVFYKKDLSDIECELNKEGARKLAEYKNLLILSGLYTPAKKTANIVAFPHRTAPMYDIGASAGTGQFLDSDLYEMVEVPDNIPESANFGLHVSGNSMEPTLMDGEEIWVHQQQTLENGEIGIFVLDGNAFVKEFRCDEQGVSLVSHNKDYEPIKVTGYSDIRIYGKVVSPLR